MLGWRILGNPIDETIKKRHLENSKTLHSIITGAPSKIKALKDTAIDNLESEIESIAIADKEVKRETLIQEIKNKNINLSRPLGNLNITVCNILNSKGLGADVVFLVGFDQGKFPTASDPTTSEIYQMLVALTRAKKRIYLINTIDKEVSNFIECLDKKDLIIKEITMK